jgi:GxxExxY protein
MAWTTKLKSDIRDHRQGPYQYYHDIDNDQYASFDASDEIEEDEMHLSTSSSPIFNQARPRHPQHHRYGNMMRLIKKLCTEIVKEYPIGHTECFYEKVLSQYLYERSIPCITQVDCFVQRPLSQVMVGRIDMEVAHTVLLELKVAPHIKQADKDQLWKYIKAKKASGVHLEHAAVICFCTTSSSMESEVPSGAKRTTKKKKSAPIEVYEADLSSIF